MVQWRYCTIPYELAYNEEHQYFDLTEDILDGDFKRQKLIHFKIVIRFCSVFLSNCSLFSQTRAEADSSQPAVLALWYSDILPYHGSLGLLPADFQVACQNRSTWVQSLECGRIPTVVMKQQLHEEDLEPKLTSSANVTPNILVHVHQQSENTVARLAYNYDQGQQQHG